MSDEICVLCNLPGHDQRLENIKFRPGVYRGYEFITDLQSSHDAYCNCDTRIEKVYKVERDFPSQWDEEPEEETSPIGQDDSMLEHFPRDPFKIMINIVCDTAPPLSPILSDSASSTSSKRSRASLSDESSGGSGNERKRAKTRSISPFSAISSSRKQSLDLSTCHLKIPSTGFEFPDSLKDPSTAFVDKTQYILELPAKFKRLLLRPPRFGKTALLSTLAHYYDIHTAETFSDDFGALAVVTKAPTNTPRPDRHLCLLFDFSQVLRSASREQFVRNLKEGLGLMLESFLYEYAKELQISDPFDYLQHDSDDLVKNIIDLARTHKRTLFVGVDDYDAPIRNSLFPDPSTRRSFASQAELEALLDLYVWDPLCAASASDVVHKLFFAGTFPLRTLVLRDFEGVAPELSPCGFSEREGREFSKMVMDAPFDVAELRRSCGQYIFPHPGGAIQPVFHPQQLIFHISQAISQFSSPWCPAFEFLASVFTNLPEESDVTGAVTTTGLIDLVATGAISIDAPMNPSVQLDEATVTWSSLYYLGAVTYDSHLPCTLRLGRSEILSSIHSRIDEIFDALYDLRERLYRVWRRGESQALVELLTEVLRNLTARSFDKAHEPDLRGVLELVMGNTISSERECIMGPLELFSTTGVSRVKMRNPTDLKKVCYWELRTLTLRGLWRAKNLNDDKPTPEALGTLHEELMKDEEEQLLERRYAVWSPSLGAMETVLVRSFLETEPDTPLFLAVGGARVLMRP
ncbi:hypothetical protein DFH06DRAFT_1292840 [Mycena polygramma]|nr:hypothetical protein DFH06DRAFT_1292840 [Mycena polygramma]